MGGRAALVAVGLAVLLLVCLPASAPAASPGQNGKLAFSYFNDPDCTPNCHGDIYTVNLDQTGRTRLTDAVAQDALPRWSPDGQRIAFLSDRDSAAHPCYPSCVYAIYVMNADGSGETRLTTPTSSVPSRPTWSPDGGRIAFTVAGDIWIMDSDGTDLAQVTNGANVRDLDWSPDGSEIAMTAGFNGIDAIKPDGTGRRTIVAPGPPSGGYGSFYQGPDWSPDGTRLAYNDARQCSGDYCGRLGTVKPDGTDNQFIFHWDPEAMPLDNPSWSPDGTRIASAIGAIFTLNPDGADFQYLYMTGGSAPDWQPLPVETLDPHVRPKGATPFRVALVPAYEPCSAPNREHGPPLAFGSCNPPQPGSSHLTVGVGDGSPALSRSEGFVRMDVKVGAPGPPEDSDVNIRVRLTNVMRAADLSEYTGDLRTELSVRRTDRDPPGAAPHSTTMGFPFGFTVPCTPTPGSSLEASTCQSFTSVNAVVPLAVEDSHRAIWALDELRVYDGGPDEDADSEGDNALFMTQGVFVP